MPLRVAFFFPPARNSDDQDDANRVPSAHGDVLPVRRPGAGGITPRWRLESGTYVDADGHEKDYGSLRLHGTKLLADGQFSFTTAQGGRFWAGGSGNFTADAETYVETPTIASYPVTQGGSYRFRYTLSGDRWTLERYEDGKRVEHEVWRRMTPTP